MKFGTDIPGAKMTKPKDFGVYLFSTTVMFTIVFLSECLEIFWINGLDIWSPVIRMFKMFKKTICWVLRQISSCLPLLSLCLKLIR